MRMSAQGGCVETELLGNEVTGEAVPLAPMANHVVTRALQADPSRVEAATFGTTGLGERCGRVRPRIAKSVHHEKRRPGRDEVGVIADPPRRKRDDDVDVTSRSQVCCDPATHRMTHDRNLIRLVSAFEIVERLRSIAKRVLPWAVPSAQPISQSPNLYRWA
jgi:hypothetical protein